MDLPPFETGLLFIGVLLALIALRFPIAVAMLASGMAGYVVLAGWQPLISYLKTSAYWTFATYDLSVVPLFLLMGQLATRGGMSRALFSATNALIGHWRGGIAMASVGACAGFGAICGSSLATAATMAQVCLPELKRYRYSGALATGALAAGGTLGILIPPSVVLVIYAILTEQNIAKVFAAAFIPGFLAALGYMIAIGIVVRRNPEAGPAGERASGRERLARLVETWPVVIVFVLVIGGIYAGWYSPTEAAAVGAFATGVHAFVFGGMRLSDFRDAILQTASATAMIFLIILGADMFNAFLALSRLPAEAADAIGGSGLPALGVIFVMLILYLALGCVMDSLSMILLTIPIFFPIIDALTFPAWMGFANPTEIAIWFGVIALIVVEVGLITPPVGMNVFLINQLARSVPMLETFKGVMPFLISDLVRVIILVLIPAITLVAPRLLFD